MPASYYVHVAGVVLLALALVAELVLYVIMTDRQRWTAVDKKVQLMLGHSGGTLALIGGTWMAVQFGGEWFTTASWLHVKLVFVVLAYGSFFRGIGLVKKAAAALAANDESAFAKWRKWHLATRVFALLAVGVASALAFMHQT